MKVTKEQFLKQRAKEQSVYDINYFVSHYDAYPCNCDWEGCQGWRLGSKSKTNPN